eukprot:SAG11_NODE_3431_length_2451_cov_1.535714_3_plen_178_part_00
MQQQDTAIRTRAKQPCRAGKKALRCGLRRNVRHVYRDDRIKADSRLAHGGPDLQGEIPEQSCALAGCDGGTAMNWCNSVRSAIVCAGTSAQKTNTGEDRFRCIKTDWRKNGREVLRVTNDGGEDVVKWLQRAPRGRRCLRWFVNYEVCRLRWHRADLGVHGRTSAAGVLGRLPGVDR